MWLFDDTANLILHKEQDAVLDEFQEIKTVLLI